MGCKGLSALAIGLALLLAGCDPFAAMTTEIDKEVPDHQVSEIELLAPDRRLPATARKVRIHFVQFQDAMLKVRFDAPLRDALEFAEQQTGLRLENGCGSALVPASELDWWLHECPVGAKFADMRLSDDPPARQIVVVPHGDMATVWMVTFTT